MEGQPEPLVHLGILRKPKNRAFLQPEFFPSKAGGAPAWLMKEKIPEVKCKKCSGEMTFLLQVYAPLDDYDHAFHRSLYCFGCLRPPCMRSKQEFTVLRGQLPLKNKYYSEEPPEIPKKKENKPPALVQGQLREMEMIIETEDKETTGIYLKETLRLSKQANPQNDDQSDTELDELTIAKGNMKHEKELLKKFEEEETELDDKDRIMKNEESKLLEELLDKQKKVDPVYRLFSAISQKSPRQVLRYAGHTDASPLWYSKENRITTVPKCKTCGEKLRFELQIMPQLFAIYTELINVEWATVAVFTCPKSCQGANEDEYLEEFCFIQYAEHEEPKQALPTEDKKKKNKRKKKKKKPIEEEVISEEKNEENEEKKRSLLRKK
eukprot:TRINITY_DN15198_c0_g1_i1.p1 TRINITY_DN15198_c0_g1~~TRINITY_DN15198_c0_g1_i1.p1  ORF type:complete len:380 (-),score=92.80 TRINITY_DN15198_c0_g1_i1:55-1194(-)